MARGASMVAGSDEHFVRPDTGPASLPVIPMFNAGRPQAIAMIRPGEQGRFVLRAWPQDASEPGKPAVEILLGSILFDRFKHPLNHLSIPTPTHHHTTTLPPLLSRLTTSL